MNTVADVYTEPKRRRMLLGYIAYTTAHVLLFWIGLAISAFTGGA